MTTDPGRGIVRISNRLQPQNPGGGARLTGPRSDRYVLPVNMDSRGSGSEGQDCVPLPRGLFQWPAPRSDDARLTGQYGWSPVEVVMISAVFVDPVGIPVTAGQVGADGGAGDGPVFAWKAAWSGLDLCDLIGGLCLDGTDGIVVLNGDAAIGVVSSVVDGASSAIAEVVSSAVAEVLSSAVAEVESSAVDEVASSAVAEVASLAGDVAEVASSAVAEVESSAVAEVAALADIVEVASLADIVEVAPARMECGGVLRDVYPT